MPNCCQVTSEGNIPWRYSGVWRACCGCTMLPRADIVTGSRIYITEVFNASVRNFHVTCKDIQLSWWHGVLRNSLVEREAGYQGVSWLTVARSRAKGMYPKVDELRHISSRCSGVGRACCEDVMLPQDEIVARSEIHTTEVESAFVTKNFVTRKDR
jgi:hypothetical protein